jgi:hypothetical protein
VHGKRDWIQGAPFPAEHPQRLQKRGKHTCCCGNAPPQAAAGQTVHTRAWPAVLSLQACCCSNKQTTQTTCVHPDNLLLPSIQTTSYCQALPPPPQTPPPSPPSPPHTHRAQWPHVEEGLEDVPQHPHRHVALADGVQQLRLLVLRNHVLQGCKGRKGGGEVGSAQRGLYGRRSAIACVCKRGGGTGQAYKDVSLVRVWQAWGRVMCEARQGCCLSVGQTCRHNSRMHAAGWVQAHLNVYSKAQLESAQSRFAVFWVSSRGRPRWVCSSSSSATPASYPPAYKQPMLVP